MYIDVTQAYKTTMDSVNLINSPKPVEYSQEEWDEIVERNKAHINIMLENDYWTTEDLEPFRLAVL